MDWDGVPTSISERRVDPRDDDGAVRSTVSDMAAIAERSQRSPVVRAFTAGALAGSISPELRQARCGAIFRAVQASVPFVPDEQQLAGRLGLSGQGLNKELLVAPDVVLRMRRPMGDCDCQAMLTAACCLAALIPCCFVVIDAHGPRWEHVFTVALLENGRPFALDTSHGPFASWSTPNAVRAFASRIMAPG